MCGGALLVSGASIMARRTGPMTPVWPTGVGRSTPSNFKHHRPAWQLLQLAPKYARRCASAYLWAFWETDRRGMCRLRPVTESSGLGESDGRAGSPLGRHKRGRGTGGRAKACLAPMNNQAIAALPRKPRISDGGMSKLNVRRLADPDYVILHRAGCDSISNDRQGAGAFTGRSYRKICATSVAELQLAAEREGRSDGSFSKRCGLCRP